MTAPPTGSSLSGRATVVMWLGIASLVTLCVYGLGVLLAVAALVLAPSARREIAAGQGWVMGENRITAGVRCAWFALGLAVLLALFYITALQATTRTPIST